MGEDIMMADISDKAIGEAITGMAKRFDSELFALSEDELRAQWYFKWDDDRTVASNTYSFFDMLGLVQRRARLWEEHHDGRMMVVERVRDKYLMPRIKEFLVELKGRMT